VFPYPFRPCSQQKKPSKSYMSCSGLAHWGSLVSWGLQSVLGSQHYTKKTAVSICMHFIIHPHPHSHPQPRHPAPSLRLSPLSPEPTSTNVTRNIKTHISIQLRRDTLCIPRATRMVRLDCLPAILLAQPTRYSLARRISIPNRRRSPKEQVGRVDGSVARWHCGGMCGSWWVGR
jgi:hypothetical protein